MVGFCETKETLANSLCRSCGLCCTGHLFIWAKLRPGELDPAEALGLNVFRSDPSQRGFSQPCPLWQGQCTIYASSHYPHICRAYKCKLLKDALAENTSFENALMLVEQAKAMIDELEALFPVSLKSNFRERLVAYLEQSEETARADVALSTLWLKADALVTFYEQVFGVDDLLEKTKSGSAE
jgi:hypothetical protein